MPRQDDLLIHGKISWPWSDYIPYYCSSMSTMSYNDFRCTMVGVVSRAYWSSRSDALTGHRKRLLQTNFMREIHWVLTIFSELGRKMIYTQVHFWWWYHVLECQEPLSLSLPRVTSPFLANPSSSLYNFSLLQFLQREKEERDGHCWCWCCCCCLQWEWPDQNRVSGLLIQPRNPRIVFSISLWK